MKKQIFLLTTILIANSCILTNNILTDKKINQTLVSESNEVKIKTTVEKYSRSKGWFYGKIEIENKTDKNLRFNFNQNISIDRTIINADWNVVPVSFAQEAFRVSPKTKVSWIVVWKYKYYNKESTEIRILEDLTITEFKKK
jgi:hypothetical protein